MPYSTVSFRMTLSDLEWLSKIFNDTKRRSVSLRQLSFLFDTGFNFGGLQTLIGENCQRWPTSAQWSPTYRTIAQIEKVKDLAMMFFIGVFDPLRLHSLLGNALSKHFSLCFSLTHNNLIKCLTSTVNTTAATTLLPIIFIRPIISIISGTCLKFLWTPAQRSLSEVHVMFCECYFYGRIMLRPRLTEVRDTFTRGGSWVWIEKLLLGFFPGLP